MNSLSLTHSSIPASFEAIQGIHQYIRKIQHYPYLEPDQEYELAEKWIKNQEPAAAEKLVTSHLRLVAKIAIGYRGYGLPMADLIAEGNLGVIHAVKKFDLSKNARFSTYATWWIKAFIQDYILKSWSLVKMGTTSAQRKLFFNLNKLRKKLNPSGQSASLNEDTLKSIAKELDVDIEEVKEMEKRLSGHRDSSLNAPISHSDGESLEWQDWLSTEDPSQEDLYIEKDQREKDAHLLQEGLNKLNTREAEVIKLRRLTEPPETLDSISHNMHISKERVRQIEVSAFNKLRDHVKYMANEKGWT